MPSETVKVAVIGLRNVGCLHVRNFVGAPGVEVVALSDVDPDRLKQAGEEYGVECLYTDGLKLIEECDADGVALALPNDLHETFAVKALEAGKHVLVEKPISRTVEEARRMIEARDRAGKVLLVRMNQRFKPDRAALRKQIASGALGRIHYGRTKWLRRGVGTGFGKARGKWSLSHETSGGGPVIDLGVHRLDLAVWLMGFPKAVSVDGATFHGIGKALYKKVGLEYGIEDSGLALIRFEDGSALFLEASYFMRRKDLETQETVLYGVKGGAEVTKEASLFINQDDELKDVELEPDLSWPKNCQEHFANVIRGKEEPITPAEQGLEIMRIIEALYQSAETGKTVYL